MSLGMASRGSQHPRSSGAQRSASMVSFIAVETFKACHMWYTVSSFLVLATRPPTTTSATYSGTAPGIQSLGATNHLGRLHKGYQDGAMAGKPHAEARNSFSGRRPLLQGPLFEDLVVRGV